MPAMQIAPPARPASCAAQQCCASAAAIFGCDAHSVFPSSTGIIGVPLPVEKLTAALPALHAGLGSSAAHLQQMAAAIMTTDTRSKIAAASFEVGGVTVRIAGIAKGAGMIHPQLQSAPQAPACHHAGLSLHRCRPRTRRGLRPASPRRREHLQSHLHRWRYLHQRHRSAARQRGQRSHHPRPLPRHSAPRRRPRSRLRFPPRSKASAYRSPSASWRTGKAFNTWSSWTSAERLPMRMLCA